jgi:RND family efflux transporter MFP subunit
MPPSARSLPAVSILRRTLPAARGLAARGLAARGLTARGLTARGLTAVAALALVAAACGRGDAASAPEPEAAIPVRTAAVERGPFARPVRAAGTVAARDEWELAFKVGGVVASVPVREGDRIRKGQVLAALDTTEVAAGVRQAREAAAKAERDLARARTLRAADAIAPAAAEDAETGAAVARAALASAEFNLRNAVIVAPDDGWVDRRSAEPGEVVAPGQPIVSVSGGGRGFVVRASLTDRDVLGLAPGTAARVTLDARPEAPLAGRVAEIARSASPGTGTYQIEIRLDAERGAPPLLAGLTAKVELARTVDADAAVPLAAVQEGDGPSGAVYVVDGERARRVPVRIAFLQEGRAVLAGGLDGVREVIAEGARVADGSRVRVVR